MTTRRKAQPGTVSHGTMRPEDLIPTFLSVAEAHALSRNYRAQVRQIRAALNAFEKAGDPEIYFSRENSTYDLDALFNILDTLSPAGHYFGAHPGDGADYGFWQSEMKG